MSTATSFSGWMDRARRLLVRTSGRVSVRRFGVAREAAGALRVMYVANSFIPTLQLSFVKPLQELVDDGQLVAELLSEQQMKERFGKSLREQEARDWVSRRIAQFRPDVLLFCRYSGPHVESMLEQADRHGVATVFHIDDDLQNVPMEIGAAKYEFHNHPSRVGAVQQLLDRADVVYCSTTALLERFRRRGLDTRGRAGTIYCSGEVLKPPPEGTPVKVGYMGFDHAHDFELALPGLVRLLDRHPEARFELFGSIPKPAALERFGDRVSTLPPVPDYQQFMAKFASLGWAIGICPLVDTPFNAVKANTKWVEYTSIGAAVVATGGSVYDRCCADGCGVLVRGDEDWDEALHTLVADAGKRKELVARAQRRLGSDYSVAVLRAQVLDVFASARDHKRQRRGAVAWQ